MEQRASFLDMRLEGRFTEGALKRPRARSDETVGVLARRPAREPQDVCVDVADVLDEFVEPLDALLCSHLTLGHGLEPVDVVFE